MIAPRLVLKGLGSQISGLSWETDSSLRIGRDGNADVVLRDNSVNELHAEVHRSGSRWILRDLANNPLFPTLVNNSVLMGQEHVLQAQDMVQIGKLLLKVTQARTPEESSADLGDLTLPTAEEEVKVEGVQMRIQASTQLSWDQAIEATTSRNQSLAFTTESLLPLLRANQHMSKAANLEELLGDVLRDVVSSLAAQRGSVLLVDSSTGKLSLKATCTANLPLGKSPVKPFSRTLAERCFRRNESILCNDVDADSGLQLARSIRFGTMSSVLCVLLRTPRRSLGILHLDRGLFQDPFQEKDLVLADALAASVAISIECAQLIEQQRNHFLETVTTLARTVEMRDQYTGDHIKRVTEYAMLLGNDMKLSPQELYQLQVGTPLHDIGKIGIDDAILRKPGKLTEGEFEAMKSHTIKGVNMLESIHDMGNMIAIVRHHHERWDGRGYPDCLEGEDIPLNARIVAVADAFDAMTSARPYRAPLSPDQAFRELMQKAGSHFDPTCVKSLVRVRPHVEKLLLDPNR